MSDLEIARLADAGDAAWCARVMATSEPWISLGRDERASLALVTDPTRETWLARAGGERVGFMVLFLGGPLGGHLQSLCVAHGHRGGGRGAALLAEAERRIFAVSPNVFLTVSSFNQGAVRFYERAGYRPVGDLPDFIVPGHSELLYRKSRGPWLGWRPPPGGGSLQG